MTEIKKIQQNGERRGTTIRFDTKSDTEIQFAPSAWDAEYDQFSPDHHEFIPFSVEELFAALSAAAPEGHKLGTAKFFHPHMGFPAKKADGFFYGEIEVFFSKV